MISDQDRQIAEDTFGLIERTTKPELDRSFLHADIRACPDCSEPQHLVSGGHENGEPWWSWMHDTALAAMQCPGLSDSARPSDVSMALAEHTARCTACELDADPGTGPLGHTYAHTCQPDVSLALAEHTAPALDAIERAARCSHPNCVDTGWE